MYISLFDCCVRARVCACVSFCGRFLMCVSIFLHLHLVSRSVCNKFNDDCWYDMMCYISRDGPIQRAVTTVRPNRYQMTAFVRMYFLRLTLVYLMCFIRCKSFSVIVVFFVPIFHRICCCFVFFHLCLFLCFDHHLILLRNSNRFSLPWSTTGIAAIAFPIS